MAQDVSSLLGGLEATRKSQVKLSAGVDERGSPGLGGRAGDVAVACETSGYGHANGNWAAQPGHRVACSGAEQRKAAT